MNVDIVSAFPRMFESVFGESIIKRTIEKELVAIRIWDLRDFTSDKHRQVDDCPFGGGPGMVMKPEPFFQAVEFIQDGNKHLTNRRTLLMSPQGATFSQQKAVQLSKVEHLVILCGHYEGVDERVRLSLVDEEISIGDYVLTGGELAAMVLVDAVIRLLPGALKDASLEEESFSSGLLEYPQYTRPREYRNMKVPDILLSGDHEKIRKWREQMSLQKTRERRPDLLSRQDGYTE